MYKGPVPIARKPVTQISRCSVTNRRSGAQPGRKKGRSGERSVRRAQVRAFDDRA